MNFLSDPTYNNGGHLYSGVLVTGIPVFRRLGDISRPVPGERGTAHFYRLRLTERESNSANQVSETRGRTQ
jgi:hypothetical protein